MGDLGVAIMWCLIVGDVHEYYHYNKYLPGYKFSTYEDDGDPKHQWCSEKDLAAGTKPCAVYWKKHDEEHADDDDHHVWMLSNNLQEHHHQQQHRHHQLQDKTSRRWK